MNVLSTYKNGNYTVMVGEDCSRFRLKKDENYVPDMPEYIEIKITNRCDKCCPWCYENTSADGVHGDVIYDKAIDSISAGTVVCITGGDIMKHPYLGELLAKLKHAGAIVSLSISQSSFMRNRNAFRVLYDLEYIRRLDVTDEFIKETLSFSNLFVNVIAGVTPRSDIQALFDSNTKLFIHGYKSIRRGKTYHSGDTGVLIDTRIQWLHDNIDSIRPRFTSISFDDLACEQLGLDRKVPDSRFSLYIDCVKKKYAKTSDSSDRRPYSDESVASMFKNVN